MGSNVRGHRKRSGQESSSDDVSVLVLLLILDESWKVIGVEIPFMNDTVFYLYVERVAKVVLETALHFASVLREGCLDGEVYCSLFTLGFRSMTRGICSWSSKQRRHPIFKSAGRKGGIYD